MRRGWRAAGYILIGAAIVIVIILAIFFFLTRSRSGLELVRGYAIAQLENSIEGNLKVARITTSGIFGGLTLHDISITDLEGRPFVYADSIRLNYRLRSFLAGNIIFNRASIFEPEVVIEQLPGDTLWNFEHIFPSGPPTPDEKRSLIQIDRVSVVGGTALVRFPIEPAPGTTLQPSDTARMIVRHVDGGLQRELRFEQVNATAPRVLWETPVEPGKLIEVSSLSTLGYIWTEPFHLTDLSGALAIRDSLISFDVPDFSLPASRGSALGELITDQEEIHYDIRIQADEISFSDLGWLYPPLPTEGGGSGIFRIQTQPVGTLYLVEDAQIHTPGTNLAGTFGMVVDDTLYFTQVDLRASPLDLRLLHELVPSAPVLEGLLIGTVEVEGPLSALFTKGELRLAENRPARQESSVKWRGTLDLLPPYGAQNLTAELRSLDLALLESYWPESPKTGRLSGRLEATGTLERALRFATELRYQPVAGAESQIQGNGTATWTRGRPVIDFAAHAEQLDFQGLASLAPALGWFEGDARGTVSARGGLDDLQIDADLRAPAGRLQLQGQLALDGGSPRYRAEGSLDGVSLDRLVRGFGLAGTGFNAHFELSGEGTDPSLAWTDLRLSIDSARIAQIDVSAASLGLRVQDGFARLDSLMVTTALGAMTAQGTLGLGVDRAGTIQVLVNADSLIALRAIFFPDAPLILDPDSSQGRVEGAARIEAEIRGAIGALEVDGSAKIRRPLIDGASAQQIDLEFSAAGVGSDSLLSYRVAVNADSLDLYGQKLDAAVAAIEFSRGGGWIEFEGTAGEPRSSSYHLVSGFRPLPGGIELDLRELRARTGPEEWGLAEPSQVRIGSAGFEVDDLLFSRTTGAGRVTATGRLPWSAAPDSAEVTNLSVADIEVEAAIVGVALPEPANLRLEFQQLPLFTLGDAAEAAPLSIADLTGTAVVTGTAFAPEIEVELALTDARFDDLRFERIDARFEYADLLVGTRITARQNGLDVLTGGGRIPLDLRFLPVAERRLDQPLALSVRANGVPAALLLSFIDGFHGVEGEIDGEISLAGTTLNPVLGGQLTLLDAAATSVESGVRYRSVAGTARVLRDQLVDLDFTARTTAGSATIGGTMDFQEFANPTFDLLILARNFQAARRRDVELTASGEIRLRGSFTHPELDGKIRVDRGTLFLDEVWRQYQIVALDDPFLFSVMDTIFGVEPRLFNEAESDFIKNMKVDAEIEIGRESWLRSRDLNVEVSGALRIAVDRSTEDIRLIGTLNAVRGTYELYVAEHLPARRFVVRGGTVEFDGTPGVNPRFDITAGYRVRTSDSQPINVLAVVTGTLESPRVALRNEGDEPIGESDLLSYLIFGRPTHALAGGESRQLDSYLTGLGAGIVTPAYLGYWALSLETIASNLGLADYVSITPTESEGTGLDDGLRAFDPLSALGRSQIEVGNYLGDDWYMAVTRRFGQGVKALDLGVRFEWRLAPTWIAEFFLEDRFARLGRYGFDQPLESRKVGGLFLFREWGF